MAADSKRYKFYLAQTGEVIHSVYLSDEDATEEKLDKIRLNLALNKGYEANSIEYEED
ncbi:MAG TPA: hypothetical protein VGE26_02570 [Sphingobacteriaceae bacterium]